MLEVALLAVAVPAAAVTLGLALRQATQAADRRGIALQTVIIMVVLVVIGGAVAAVLVSRTGTETERLEDADSQLDANQYPNEALCLQASTTARTLEWHDNDTPADESDDECRVK